MLVLLQRITYKLLLQREYIIEEDSELSTLLNDDLHGFMSADVFGEFKLHRVFILSDAGDDANVVRSDLEVVPWIREIPLTDFLLPADTVDVVVEVKAKPLRGDGTKARPEFS